VDAKREENSPRIVIQQLNQPGVRRNLGYNCTVTTGKSKHHVKIKDWDYFMSGFMHEDNVYQITQAAL
jgi:hypothetical protein